MAAVLLLKFSVFFSLMSFEPLWAQPSSVANHLITYSDVSKWPHKGMLIGCYLREDTCVLISFNLLWPFNCSSGGNPLWSSMDFDLSNLRFSTLTDMGQYCKERVIKLGLHQPCNAQDALLLSWTSCFGGRDIKYPCEQPGSEFDCA